MLLDVHKTFRKTGKKISITKFQKIEFFYFCDLLYVYTYIILKLFSVTGYYKILTIVPCAIQ